MPNIITTEYFKTPFGELILGSIDNKLCLCDWRYRKMRDSIDGRIKAALDADYSEGSSDIITKAKTQLEEYFQGERTDFSLDLLELGTDFQISVWNALKQITYGTTETYLGLSEKIDNVKAIRAVASANGANAISIIIPCHRIIGSNDKLVGYAGGLATKKKLLTLENALNTDQLSLF